MSAAFGPDGTGGSESFSKAAGVAVDKGEEVLYVLDSSAGALYKFDLEGHPIDFGGSGPNLSGNKLSGLSIGGIAPGERQVAVNPSTDVVYLTGEEVGGEAKALQAFHANGEPAVFSATGDNKIDGFIQLRGVAVDENGAIYTGEGAIGGKNVQVWEETGAPMIDSLGISGPANLALDGSGVLYVLRNSLEVAKYTPSQYPVTPTTTYTASPNLVDPNHAHALAVDRQTGDLYVAEAEPIPRMAIYDENGVKLETFAGPGESGELKSPAGVAVFTNEEEEERVYVADSPEGGPSRVKIFVEDICECAPVIEATSVSDISGDSATLHAKINPFKQATTYWFEYGLEDCAVGPCEKVPAEGGSIAATKRAAAVQFALSGLQPGTTYHFRVLAENGKGLGEPSADRTFTTQAPGLGAGLADSRAWEMVSPPKKFGGVVFTSESTAIQASSSGDKLAYASLGSLLEEPTSNRVPEPASLVAERGPGGEWTNRELTPAHNETSLFLHGQTEFKLFTSDLLRSAMEPSEDTPLAPEATERTPYLWEDGQPPAFTPLLTPANVPPGTELNPKPTEANRVSIAGASPDLSVIAISSKPPLVAGAANESLYAWADGTLEAVSELPSGEGGAVVKGAVGTREGSVRHAVSEDGSRVFWSSFENMGGENTIEPTGLYLRDREAGESFRLDVKQTGASGTGVRRPSFAGASADGSVVFFTDSQRLTLGASPAGRDLYRCEIGPVGGGLGCAVLTDISAPIPGSGGSAEVIDQIPAIGEDGTRLFFVARGVLDEEANEAGDSAKAGEPNLYYWEEGSAPRFVAMLAEEDFRVWGASEPGKRGIGVNISATISPSGRYLAFTSQQSLTGYENQNAGGHPNTEVFLYDTEGEGERLSCISCNPTGASAIGEQLSKKSKNFPPDRGVLWGGRWTAATLPEATQAEFSGPSLYRPRTVLDNGRVFFNSVDPLVGADSNGDWDVYQYEPLGVGSCAAANTSGATVARSANGCVGLLSSGSAAGDAGFLDASPSGNDAFFLTPTRLSVLDRDEELDVYDARVNGIPAVLHPVQECAGEACQPSAGPPDDPTPASESFKGAETPVVCWKGQKKVRRQGRVLCVKKHHKHKRRHHKHRKPAKRSGRASR